MLHSINHLNRRHFLLAVAALTSGGAVNHLLAACAAPYQSSTGSAVPSQSSSPTAHPVPTASPAAVRLQFPDGFLWGTATSAYQIEGAAKEDGRGESVWDRLSHTPGRTHNGDTGDIATDHYHRYEQDLDLMHDLGFQTYRFSIAWSRIFPTGAGEVNQKGLDFYRRLVDGLLKRNIQPMATLWHWDLPQALEDKGGWVNRDTAQHFADYAHTVYQALGDVVPSWLTLNEPKTVVMVGYIYGVHAPGLQSLNKAYIALHHMLLAHGLATQALRATVQQGRIGIALNLSPVYAANDDSEAKDAVYRQDGFENRLYLDPVLRGRYPEDMLDRLSRQSSVAAMIKPNDLGVIGTPIDLLGVNYYSPTYVTATGGVVSGPHPHTIAPWLQIYPDGLYDLLVRIKHDYGPIALSITENGMPANDVPDRSGQVNDSERIKFLFDHFTAAHRAITAGVNLKSYHVWSLLDNFEWAEGYSQRWGIVYVDFATQQRSPKRSAFWYRDVTHQNGLGELPIDMQ